MALRNGSANGPPGPASRKHRDLPKVTVDATNHEAMGISLMAQELVKNTMFDAAIGVVILLSTVCMGLQQAEELQGHGTMGYEIVEGIFLFIYICEFAVRAVAHGWACLRDNWVKFDLFLIVLGVLTSWILPPIFHHLAPDTGVKGFGPLMMIRMLRLMRLAKLARLFTRIKEFWLLIRGFMGCVPIFFYTVLVFLFCLFGLGCLGVEIIAKHPLVENDETFQDQALKHFGTLPRALLTLLRFACLDNTSEVYSILVDKDPVLSFYFVTVIFLVSLVMFHLLGAVLVASTLEKSQHEVDEMRKEQAETWNKLLSGLQELFCRLDLDMSGQLSKAELTNIDPTDMKRLKEALGQSGPHEIFDSLDVDKSGEVSIAEFFDGIREKVLSSTVEQKRMEQQIEVMSWRVKEIFNSQYEMKLQLGRMASSFEKQGIVKVPSRRPGKTGVSVAPLMPLNLQCAAKGDRGNLPPWAQELVGGLEQSWQQCLLMVEKAARAGMSDEHPSMQRGSSLESMLSANMPTAAGRKLSRRSPSPISCRT